MMRKLIFLLTFFTSCCILLCSSHPSVRNVEILENSNESVSNSDSGENKNYMRARIGRNENKKIPSTKMRDENLKCGYEVIFIHLNEFKF